MITIRNIQAACAPRGGGRLRAVAFITLALAAVTATGCGESERLARGCVIVDISESSRREIRGQYLPGMDRFVSRIAEESGDVCFGFAAQGLLGGPAAWGKFACTNPEDRLRCRPEIRQQVEAAAGQLAAQARTGGPRSVHGASELVEALGLLAPNTRPGDEILLLSDAIQNSRDFGNFYSRHLALDAHGRQRLFERLKAARLLPDLTGRKLRIPYGLTHSRGTRRMRAVRQQEIRAFWTEYAERVGAELTFGGGEREA